MIQEYTIFLKGTSANESIRHRNSTLDAHYRCCCSDTLFVCEGKEMNVGKPKAKYDRWYMIFWGIILYTVASQLISLVIVLPYNIGNLAVWTRFIATFIALFGCMWMIKTYIRSVKDAQRLEKEKQNSQVASASKTH